MQGEASQDAPTTASEKLEKLEKLWQHYQRPAKKSWPDDREPMRRYEWSLEVLRLDLTLETRAVALTLSLLGNADGTGMIPADPRFLGSVDLSYRQAVGTHIAQLQELKLLTLVKRAGGRTGVKAHVFQLSLPLDLGELPLRLDANFERFEQRSKGSAPVKAIEASMAARIERKVASGHYRPASRNGRNGTSGETAVDGAIDRNTASDETGIGHGVEQKAASVETASEPDFEQNPASGQSPVDNPIHRNHTSAQTPDDDQTGQKAASGENEFHRKASTLSPEAQHTFIGSAASDSVVKTIKPTTPVLSLGGDPPDAREPTTDETPQMSPAARYAAANDLIQSLSSDEADALIQTAGAELRAEGHPHSARALVIRAAEIAARPEWDTA